MEMDYNTVCLCESHFIDETDNSASESVYILLSSENLKYVLEKSYYFSKERCSLVYPAFDCGLRYPFIITNFIVCKNEKDIYQSIILANKPITLWCADKLEYGVKPFIYELTPISKRRKSTSQRYKITNIIKAKMINDKKYEQIEYYTHYKSSLKAYKEKEKGMNMETEMDMLLRALDEEISNLVSENIDDLYNIIDSLELKPDTKAEVELNQEEFENLYNNIVSGKLNTNNTINFNIKDVFYNEGKGVTVVIWEDNTKTILHCAPNEVFDYEKAVALAHMKKLYGNDSSFNEILQEWCPTMDEDEEEE